MSERNGGRGRGRAALMLKVLGSSQEQQSAAAIEASEVASIVSSEEDKKSVFEPPKARGRGSLFLRQDKPSSDSGTSVTHTSTETSKGSSGSTGEVSTYLTSGIESGSGSDTATSVSTHSQKSKASGRASLLGLKSSGYQEEISSQLKELVVAEVENRGRRSETIRSPPVVKQGYSGEKVCATANRIRLQLLDKHKGINEYEVIFKPEVDHVRERAYLVNQAWKSAGGTVKIFDNGWRLFSPIRLKDDIFVCKNKLRSGTDVEVKIIFKVMKSFDDCKFVLNIIFKRIMGELQLVKFGRSDYNPKAAHVIPEYKLSVWPGCVTAVEEYEGGIQLSCDASHRVLRNENCYDIIMEITKKHCQSGSRGFDNTVKNDIVNTFVGLTVLTKYNNKTFRIEDVDFETTPSSTFERGGQQITYVDYYKMQYNITIKDTRQPVFVHRIKRKPREKENEELLVHLIPELCAPTGLTDEMRSNFKLMKSVADFTRINPTQRQAALREFIRGIKGNEKAHSYLKDWGLQLPDTTLELTARILQPETLNFGRNVQIVEKDADWGRAASNNYVLSPIDLSDWFILHVQRDKKCVDNLCENMREISKKIGMRINKPHIVCVEAEAAKFYLEKILSFTKQKSYQLVVAIFPSQRDDRYSAVKRLCNIELGLASQVINSRTLSNPKSLKSVVTKIILQINCKIGGALWGVIIPFKQQGIMFCGVDTYHDSVHKKKSVVAFVASLNVTCTRWTSNTATHNIGQEISDVIMLLFKECLQQWYKTTGQLPERIVMYRDGVGDGQLKVVRDFEVPQLSRVFPLLKPDYKPKLTYIVVQKRINTRLYFQGRGDEFRNPPPGTVVDNIITRRDWYDYFLVSQNVRQGTVSPTHYVVVFDDSDMSVDQIQKLSYKMTHLYYNWNGTVRVPAPCQYAHKLAYLVGQHMHGAAADNLRNLLYFL